MGLCVFSVQLCVMFFFDIISYLSPVSKQNMINIDRIKKWFGYDRKERRASFILLCLIAVFIIIRYAYPVKNIDVQDVTLYMVSDSAPSISYSTILPAAQAETKQVRSVKKLLNLNNCDSAALEALPGIGPVLSARIIKYRNLIGGYARVEQLREVYGLPQETYELIKSRVFADTSLLRHINVNSAEYRDLDMLPYIRRFEIYSIIKYRDINKHIGSIDELVLNKIIPDSTARKIKPYVIF